MLLEECSNYKKINNVLIIFERQNYPESFLQDLCQTAQDFFINKNNSTNVADPIYLFSTSGSTGRPKFVVHTEASLRSCAQGCGKWFDLQPSDRWMNVLSAHHMGGFSTYFRTACLGLRPVYTVQWNSPQQIIKLLVQEECNLLSLVPTQVFELVSKNLQAPAHMKMVLVGGGALDPGLQQEAKDLGWPIFSSLGSTETGSQIFTDVFDLSLSSKQTSVNAMALPHFDVRTTSEGVLQVRGAGVFKAHIVVDDEGTMRVEPALLDKDGFWTSQDMVELSGRSLLSFRGRASDHVKILGHLVNVAELRQRFMQTLPMEIERDNIYVDVLPDAKSDQHLVLYKQDFNELLERAVRNWNAQVASHERIRGEYLVNEIPRSALGKVKAGDLKKYITS